MSPPPKPMVAGVALLAAAVVLSPLLAALFGTGLDARAVASAMGEIGTPLGGSLATSLIGAIAAIVLGVPFALLVERSQPRFRRACWVLGLLVLMMPPYVVSESAVVLLGPAGKLARPVAIALGFGPDPTDPVTLARFNIPGFVYTRAAVGVVMGGCLFPIVALAVASALRRTDHRVFESARLARGKPGIWRIGFGLLAPPILGASLLVFALTLTEFAVPQLLRVRTVPESVHERIQEGDLATAAALSLPLLPAVLAAGAAGAFLLARARVASLAGLEGDVPRFEGPRSGRVGHLAAGAATLLAITPALLLPCLSLGWLASAADPSGSPMAGHHRLLRTSGIVNAFRGTWHLAGDDAIRTVLLAAGSATLATILATALARLTSRSAWGLVAGLLGAGLAVPAPIVGLGLIVLWNRGGGAAIYRSPAIVLLAWLARFLPIAVFLAQAALARVPRELEEAAAMAGRGAIGRFRAAVIPGAAPGLAAAWLAVYVLSATEFAATVLISPPGKSLLAPTVMNFMRRGQDPEIAACQVLLLCVVASPLALIVTAMFICSQIGRAWRGAR